jgi:Flp pilus assembly protein TadG
MWSTLRRFARESRGNVAMIFAISLIPLVYLTGMGVDYGSAAMREAQLNAIADSASLAAVTPSMMAQGDSASITAARNYFNAQATNLQGVTYNAANLSVTVTDSITTRQVQVSYTATSSNFFPTVLGQSTIALNGSSTAVGSVAPNINFYILLDDSPSMGIPASSSGINTLISNTSSQGGCAFACHESNPGPDNLGNPSNVHCADGTTKFPTGGEDNFALAQCLGLTLRIDNVRAAVQALTTTATTTATQYGSAYKMALYTFDANFHTIATLTATLSTVSSDASSVQLLTVYDNNNITNGTNNSDEDTNWDGALTSINATSIMPNPGNGTNASGDTPQEVLFIVTDGMIDQHTSSQPSLSSHYGAYCCSGRQQSTVNPLNGSTEAFTDRCTTIKNRGIRIAVLYTQYYPLGTSNSWFNSYVAPLIPPSASQDNIGDRLQACASPGLYYAVTTDGDITAAMNALFQEAVATAHLLR